MDVLNDKVNQWNHKAFKKPNQANAYNNSTKPAII